MLEGKTDLPPPQGFELTLTIISSHDRKWEIVRMAHSKGWVREDQTPQEGVAGY